MKNIKRVCAIALLLALCVSLCTVSAFADELWSEEYYRVYDCSEQLSEAETDSLDEACLAFVKQYKADIALLAVTENERDDIAAYEQAKGYYDKCSYGYGDDRDGFLWVYDTDNRSMKLFCFGAAEGMIPQDYIDFAAEKAPELLADHGLYGVLYGGVRYLSRYLDDHAATNTDAQGTGEAVERVAEGSSMPAWYPASTENFPFYHDEDAPRVVDAADIFTDAEEQAMEARIGEIRRELQRDIVIYTDTSDYGLSHKVCAADFYDFNGYGYGDGREGMCLFVDMDPADRGWWACATGSETRGLYTEDTANLIDDALYEYMAAGDYGTGVANWIENIRTLYRKGSPFAPEWYPEAGGTIERFHDPDAPRVVDELGVLSDAELSDLTAHAKAIADKYGVDVAIHTMLSPVGLGYADVAELYYRHMGYGTGDNYDGILLSVFKRPGYYATTRITAVGSVADKLTETNGKRLRDFCEDKTGDEKYFEGLDQWLTQVDHMERTGRVPRSTAYWAFITALGALLGSAFGGVGLGVAKAKMAPPKEQHDADAYIDPKNSSIRETGRHYLYTSTARRYDPPPKKSSGGGSSGRSSYSSSYRGSSGSSHSGSGRRF